MKLEARLRQLNASGLLDLPLPGSGKTPERHRRLLEVARQDLTLARLVEAHTDAMAILAEANRDPQAGTYGVWAAESPGHLLTLEDNSLTGSKMFCSGAGLVDRALVTVGGGMLVDVDLRAGSMSLSIDGNDWKAPAFAETQTATVTFLHTPVIEDQIIGKQNWYLERPGFWHGACGPAACWAGGAIGLFDYAVAQSRDDPHTMAHLAAMGASVWALRAFLDCAGTEIDMQPQVRAAASIRALTVRHLVEQACADILRRLGRAYGPRALAYSAEVSKRYQELDLYIRQSHAERDLEVLGRLIHKSR